MGRVKTIYAKEIKCNSYDETYALCKDQETTTECKGEECECTCDGYND